MFKCKLEIDGRYTKLSLENGIHLTELTVLLSKLAKIIETDKIKYTLTGIEGNSYDPVLETETQEGTDKFLEVHEKIQNNNFDDLDENYKEYAKALDELLFDKGIYVIAGSNNSEKKIEIGLIKQSQEKKHTYSSITSITGKIVSIVGKSEDKPYIVAQTNQGVDYKIYINPEQEEKLSQFYKKYNIRFRIRIKREVRDVSTTGLITATLFDYKVPALIKFTESIAKTKLEFGDIFANIQDSARLIRETRNYNTNE